jgi:transaldolase
MGTRLQALSECGQSPWVDFVSRRFLERGELDALIGDGIKGVTANATIFRKAIAEDREYEIQLRRLAAGRFAPYDAFLEIAREDIRMACDALADTHANRLGAVRDGWVSLEVDPGLAHDAQRTVTEARRLYETVDRGNLMVKIPGTEAGLQAIEESIAAGIPVNVTLLFSLQRHREAAEAYVRGLRRLYGAGGSLDAVASVASFVVSRIDVEADRMLDEVGGPENLKGTLAIASAKLAYQNYLQVFSGSAWEELVDAGATPQRCLWASTSTKNSDGRDVRYVEALIGPETVTTMPPKTVAAFQDHGQVERTLDADVEEALGTFAEFAAVGIDYHDLVEMLELDGVAKFGRSFDRLLEAVASSLRGAVA